MNRPAFATNSAEALKGGHGSTKRLRRHVESSRQVGPIQLNKPACRAEIGESEKKNATRDRWTRASVRDAQRIEHRSKPLDVDDHEAVRRRRAAHDAGSSEAPPCIKRRSGGDDSAAAWRRASREPFQATCGLTK